MYRLTDKDDVVVRESDQTLIPRGHWLWDEYERWCAAGGVPSVKETALPVQSVTMRQTRLQLLTMGLLQQVDEAVAAMPGSEGDVARIEWGHAATVERHNPTALALWAMLGLTDEQADTFFLQASLL